MSGHRRTWFVVLPDTEAGSATAAVWGTAERRAPHHPGGRPWILGDWPADESVTVQAGSVTPAVPGTSDADTHLRRRLGCDVRDIADVAAETLLRPGLDGATYALTGPQAFSHSELAHLLGELTSRPVRYIDMSPDEFHGHLVRTAHLPDWLASHVVEIQQLAIARPESPNDTVETVLGRPARTLGAFIHEHLAMFAPVA